MGHYFGWMGVIGGRWDITQRGWGWVRKYFGWVSVDGDEWGWVHYLIMLILYKQL